MYTKFTRKNLHLAYHRGDIENESNFSEKINSYSCAHADFNRRFFVQIALSRKNLLLKRLCKKEKLICRRVLVIKILMSYIEKYIRKSLQQIKFQYVFYDVCYWKYLQFRGLPTSGQTCAQQLN